MTNEQMAARLESIAVSCESVSSADADIPALRAGAQALRTLDEIHAAAEKHAGHEIGLWPMSAKVMAAKLEEEYRTHQRIRAAKNQFVEERDAAQREVERLRNGIRDIGKMLEIPAAEYVPAIGDVFLKCDELLGASPTPDPRDARIAELEAALKEARRWISGTAPDEVWKEITDALKEGSDDKG